MWLPATDIFEQHFYAFPTATIHATFLAHLTQLDLVKLLKFLCITDCTEFVRVEFYPGSFASSLQDLQ